MKEINGSQLYLAKPHMPVEYPHLQDTSHGSQCSKACKLTRCTDIYRYSRGQRWEGLSIPFWGKEQSQGSICSVPVVGIKFAFHMVISPGEKMMI